jgi:uncharacterized membrane protein
MLRLRHYFVTGLLLVLPVFITFYFLFLIFRFIDGILGGLINSYLKNSFGFVIPGVGLVVGILIVLFSGFLASHFLGKKVLPTLEKLVLRFPGSRQIYPSAKQIISFLFSKEKTGFKKVVLVEYPSKGVWAVGFVTNEGFKEAQEKTQEELIHIFIPSPPSPWSGFLALIPKKNIKFLDMSIEDGIKLIISGGILKPITYNKVCNE